MTWPRCTTAPTGTAATTGSTLDRRSPGCSTATTGRPATIPANAMTPSAGANTGAPAAAARSVPRWPALYFVAGATNSAVTSAGAVTGHCHVDRSTSPGAALSARVSATIDAGAAAVLGALAGPS